MWKPWWPLAVCECGEQFGDCPFWQGVLDDAFGSEQEAKRARLEELGEGFIRHSVMPTLRNSHPKSKFFGAFKEAGALLEPVYRAAAERSGATMLVEATKAGMWGYCAATSDAIDLAVVRLVRDPRGFTFSNARARAFHYPPGSMTTPRGPARSYINWTLSNIEGDLLRRRAYADTYLLYEDLVRDPAAAIRSITKALGIDAQSTSALDNDTLVIDRAGHAIGGNPKRPKRGSTVITIDDEWKTKGRKSLRASHRWCCPSGTTTNARPPPSGSPDRLRPGLARTLLGNLPSSSAWQPLRTAVAGPAPPSKWRAWSGASATSPRSTTSRSRSLRVSSSGSSGPTARARPRRSRFSARCCDRAAGPPGSPATTLRPSANRCARISVSCSRRSRSTTI